MSDAMYERTESRSPLAHLGSKKPYVPHDVIDETTKTAVVGAASGLFVAAIRNAVARNNVGAFSVFTRGAPIIGLCSMLRPMTSVLYIGRTSWLTECFSCCADGLCLLLQDDHELAREGRCLGCNHRWLRLW